ncbi:MAG: hypothetical protein HZB39_07145 [Planctomycetes bacterium]|nr:hypothetical protein [Planctomycetota bacterium]
MSTGSIAQAKRRTVAAGLAALLALVIAACAGLPDDHAARDVAQRTATRVGRLGEAANGILASVKDDLRSLAPSIARVETGLTRDTRNLGDDVQRLAAVPRDEFSERPARVRDHAERAVTSTSSALTRTGRGIVRALGAVPDVARVRAAIEGAPAILHLDHRPMAEPGDPERQTSLERARRPQSWPERLLRRMGQLF